MFYSVSLLSQKGPLALVWLVAHSARKTGRREISGCDLASAVREVLEPSGGPIALRMAAHLCFGITVIYSRKTELLYKDSLSFFRDLGDMRSRRRSNIDLADGDGAGGGGDDGARRARQGRRGRKRGADHLLPIDEATGAPASETQALLSADPTLLADLAAIEEEGQASFFFLDAADLRAGGGGAGAAPSIDTGGMLARSEEAITLQDLGAFDEGAAGALGPAPGGGGTLAGGADGGGALPELDEPYDGALGAHDADAPAFEPDAPEFAAGDGGPDALADALTDNSSGGAGAAAFAAASEGASAGAAGAADGGEGEAGAAGQRRRSKRKRASALLVCDAETVLSTDTLKSWMMDTEAITVDRPAKRVLAYDALAALAAPSSEGLRGGACDAIDALFAERAAEGNRLGAEALERVRAEYMGATAAGAPSAGAGAVSPAADSGGADFGDLGALGGADFGGDFPDELASGDGLAALEGEDLEAERLRDAMATQQPLGAAGRASSGGTHATNSSGHLPLDDAAGEMMGSVGGGLREGSAGSRGATTTGSGKRGRSVGMRDLSLGGGEGGGSDEAAPWVTQNPTDCPLSQYQLAEESAPRDGRDGSLTQTQLLESQALARRAMDAQAVNALAFLRARARRDGAGGAARPHSLASIASLARGTPAQRRSTASKFFYRVLVLASNAYIRVDQDEPYADVKMENGINFWSGASCGGSPGGPGAGGVPGGGVPGGRGGAVAAC